MLISNNVWYTVVFVSLLQLELPGGVWHNDSNSDNDTSQATTSSSQQSANDNDDTLQDSVVAQSTSAANPSINSSSSEGSVHKVTVPIARSVPSRTTALNTYSSLRKVEEEKKKHVSINNNVMGPLLIHV